MDDEFCSHCDNKTIADSMDNSPYCSTSSAEYVSCNSYIQAPTFLSPSMCAPMIISTIAALCGPVPANVTEAPEVLPAYVSIEFGLEVQLSPLTEAQQNDLESCAAQGMTRLIGCGSDAGIVSVTSEYEPATVNSSKYNLVFTALESVFNSCAARLTSGSPLEINSESLKIFVPDCVIEAAGLQGEAAIKLAEGVAASLKESTLEPTVSTPEPTPEQKLTPPTDAIPSTPTATPPTDADASPTAAPAPTTAPAPTAAAPTEVVFSSASRVIPSLLAFLSFFFLQLC